MSTMAKSGVLVSFAAVVVLVEWAVVKPPLVRGFDDLRHPGGEPEGAPGSHFDSAFLDFEIDNTSLLKVVAQDQFTHDPKSKPGQPDGQRIFTYPRGPLA